MRRRVKRLLKTKDSNLQALCRAFLAGGDCLFALRDRALELGVWPMMSLKIGSNYVLRTLSLYYKGTVKAVTDTDVVLVNCSTVYNEGPLATAYNIGGHVDNEERHPIAEDEVPINIDHIQAAIPFHGEL